MAARWAEAPPLMFLWKKAVVYRQRRRGSGGKLWGLWSPGSRQPSDLQSAPRLTLSARILHARGTTADEWLHGGIHQQPRQDC